MFITFEGIDGSGKSTQIERLKQKLLGQGHRVEVFRDPGGSILSEKIRSLLLDSDLDIDPVAELLLFSAARAQLITEKVKPLLEQGTVVILDRYYDSTVAYQGYGRNSLPLKEINQINKIASHHTPPDITFYLKLSLEEARRRTAKNSKDRMERAGTVFYEKAIVGFDALADREERIKVIDATGSAQKTHQQIMKLMEKQM